jgi:RNA polymerase sigma-70 factor (ECF subfamily)
MALHRENVIPLHREGELPDGSLVREALAGQVWAKEALFRRHVKRLLALSYRLLPEDDQEDLVQEAFIIGFAKLSSLSNPAVFGAWMSTVVVSLVKMRLRKRQWLSRLGLYDFDPIEPEELVSNDAPAAVYDDLRQVYRVLQSLPAEQRVALVLQRVEGLELSEVAEKMGISIATVKRRIVEAEKRLGEMKSDE